MKSGGSLRRTGGPKRTGRLAPASARRIGERELREVVVAYVNQRDRTCTGPGAGAPGGCWGPLDVDEACPRSSWRQGYLVAWNCQLLCRGHHDWKHANYDDAVALGLRVSLMAVHPTPLSWVVHVEGAGLVELGADTPEALQVQRDRIEPLFSGMDGVTWELVDRRDPLAVFHDLID